MVSMALIFFPRRYSGPLAGSGGNARSAYLYAVTQTRVLQLLETFCAVADAGSLTRATEHLHLTQPAISRQLSALERQLGAVLLTRTPQGVLLTQVGRDVLVHARAAVAAAEACRQVASEGASGGTHRLRIAAGLMATQYLLPPVVARFRALHPDLEIDLQPVDRRVAVSRLLGYEVDVAVVASPVRSPQVRSTPILRDPLLFVSSPSAESSPVQLSDLRNTQLLLLAPGTGLNELIKSALSRRHIACHLVEYPTAETIKTAVALQMGVTILPASAVQQEVRSGTLSGRAFTGWPGASRVIQLLVRAQGRPPRPVATFLALLKQHYAGLR
jgi:DNA-binding transcriptional LysR family regulator